MSYTFKVKGYDKYDKGHMFMKPFRNRYHSVTLPPSGLYYRKFLPSSIRKNYRAAGVIPYLKSEISRANGDEELTTMILLGLQDCRVDGKRDRWAIRWNDFGGKVDETDKGPVHTAVREFHEETQNKIRYVDLDDICIWNRPCKYIVFFGRMSNLPEDFKCNEKDQEVQDYRWVVLDNLVETLKESEKMQGIELSYRLRSTLYPKKHSNYLKNLGNHPQMMINHYSQMNSNEG
jgi:8-oxo-dGTP pyrophosphatase MutT (NUDIX family)